MLNMTKNVTLNGVISINGEAVVYMNATINTDGGNGANINKTIVNQDLYNKNKESVRLESDQFETEVYNIEDGMMAASQPAVMNAKVVK